MIIHADDASVKGGAWYPLSVKKIVRTLDIAIENRLPVVHLCDSAGGFLPLQAELFADRYYAGPHLPQPVRSSSKMGVPQVALVLGHCTAGGAYVPALSDYNVIVRGTGAIFLGGPPLVKAATGEVVTVEELGGADMHTQHLRHRGLPGRQRSSRRSRSRARSSPSSRRREKTDDRADRARAAALRSGGALRHHPARHQGAVRHARGDRAHRRRQPLPRVPAGLRHHAGLRLRAHLWGYKVGILANNGVLFNDSSLKGAHFMQLCNQNRTPMIFLQNITGYMVGREYEHRGITKDGAKMIMAVAGSRGAEVHRDRATARSAPATTACPAAPSIRASCSCGRRARSP